MPNGNGLRNLGSVLSEQWPALKSACIILHNLDSIDSLFKEVSGLTEHGDQIALLPQKRGGPGQSQEHFIGPTVWQILE